MAGSNVSNPSTEITTNSDGISRGYSMVFWFLFGAIGSVVGTAVVVSEMYPSLSPRESCRIIWTFSPPIALSVIVFGWFATRNRRVRNWSVVGFVVLVVAARIASYVAKFMS